ncbi:hypothetical protein [Streptomyces sp. NPDC050422]
MLSRYTAVRGRSALRSLARRTRSTSESAFAEAFKREYGTAPGQYCRRAG